MSVSLLGFSLGPSSFSTLSICRQCIMLLRDDSRMHQLCSKCLIFTYPSACQLSSLHIAGMAAECPCTWLI